MPDITMPSVNASARSLCIFANASTDAATRTGNAHAVDTDVKYLRFKIDVATGAVIEIYGVDTTMASDGTFSDISFLLGTFSANDDFYVENNVRFDRVYAKTTTKPSAGTASVWLTRSNI